MSNSISSLILTVVLLWLILVALFMQQYLEAAATAGWLFSHIRWWVLSEDRLPPKN